MKFAKLGDIVRRVSPIDAAFLTIVGALLGVLGQYGVGQIQDKSEPVVEVGAFIEDVAFGLPTVSSTYKDGLTMRQISHELKEFRESGDEILLSQQEALNITDIATKSGQANSVISSVGYSTNEISDMLAEAMLLYARYDVFVPRLKGWSGYLKGIQNQDRIAEYGEFLSVELRTELDNSMLLSGITGLADLGRISLDSSDDCLEKQHQEVVRVYDDEGRVVKIELQTYTLNLLFSATPNADNSPRHVLTKDLADLIAHGCIDALVRIFNESSDLLNQSKEHLSDYIDAWNKVIGSRKSEAIRLTVVFSNLGKFDSFVRTQAKIAVGPKNDPSFSPIHVNMVVLNDEGLPEDSSFLSISSRKAETVKFMALLDTAQREQVHGIFMGKLAYIRGVFLANVGETERLLFSPSVPFSSKAKEQALKLLTDTHISIE